MNLLTRRVWLRGLWALTAVTLPHLAACTKRVAFQSVDVTGADWGKGFALQDSDGRTRTMADFHGKVLLLFFGFTQCPDICPTALSRAADVMRLLGDDGNSLQVIFVTIDPERDSAAVLRDYTQAFHPSFLGLAGDLPSTRAVAREFKVFYQKIPTGSSYTMDHSSISYILDRGGNLRLAVKYSQPASSVASDIRNLLQEAAG